MWSTWRDVDPRSRLLLLTELAGTQHGLFTTAQAAGCGIGRTKLMRMVKEGRIERLRHAVYCVAGAPRTRRRDLLEACLSAGPDAVLSHNSAAELHGLEEVYRRDKPHVLVGPSGRTVKNAVIHRSRRIEPADRMMKEALPTTTPLRTLLDMAPVLSEASLELALMDACRRSLIDPDLVAAVVAELPRGLRGLQKLRNIVAHGHFREFHRSKLEARALRIIAGRYPEARSNFQVIEGGEELGEVDVAFPELKIAIECDSEKYHSTREQKAKDRAKTRRLRAAGWIVLRIWWRHTIEPATGLVLRLVRARRAARDRLATRTVTPAIPLRDPTYFIGPPPPGWA